MDPGSPSGGSTVFDAANALVKGVQDKIGSILAPPPGPLYPGPQTPSTALSLSSFTTIDIDDADARCQSNGLLLTPFTIQTGGSVCYVDPISDAWCFIELDNQSSLQASPIVARPGTRITFPFTQLKLTWPLMQTRFTNDANWAWINPGFTSRSLVPWMDITKSPYYGVANYPRRLRLLVGSGGSIDHGASDVSHSQKFLSSVQEVYAANYTTGMTNIFGVGDSAPVENMVMRLTGSNTPSLLIGNVWLTFYDSTFSEAPPNLVHYLEPVAPAYYSTGAAFTGDNTMTFRSRNFRMPSGLSSFAINWNVTNLAVGGNVTLSGNFQS